MRFREHVKVQNLIRSNRPNFSVAKFFVRQYTILRREERGKEKRDTFWS